jgi:YesN/AraC family two-component response regulator
MTLSTKKILFSSDLHYNDSSQKGSELIGTEILEDASFEVEETVKLRRFTLLHVLKGQGSFEMAMESYTIQTNHIYFGYPGQILSNVSLKGLHGFLLYADKELILRANPEVLTYELFHLYDQKHEISATGAPNEKIVNLSKELFLEANSHFHRRQEMLLGLINLHILHTDRLFQQRKLVADTHLHPKVKAFLTLMNFSDNPNVPVTHYAEELHISPNYLNELIKNSMGRSVKVLIKERVIEKACVLLIHTSMEVKEIAYALGYSYPQYFDNDFKKMTGNTPLQYRGSNR